MGSTCITANSSAHLPTMYRAFTQVVRAEIQDQFFTEFFLGRLRDHPPLHLSPGTAMGKKFISRRSTAGINLVQYPSWAEGALWAAKD
jgi:hypothetical protein